jgi:hypothetical protein
MTRKLMIKVMTAAGHVCDEAADGLLGIKKIQVRVRVRVRVNWKEDQWKYYGSD